MLSFAVVCLSSRIKTRLELRGRRGRRSPDVLKRTHTLGGLGPDLRDCRVLEQVEEFSDIKLRGLGGHLLDPLSRPGTPTADPVIVSGKFVSDGGGLWRPLYRRSS